MRLQINLDANHIDFLGPSQLEMLEILWDAYPGYIDKELILKKFKRDIALNTVASICNKLCEKGLAERTQMRVQRSLACHLAYVYRATYTREQLFALMINLNLRVIKNQYPDEFRHAIKEIYGI